jgi:uncharacterized membrane protein YkvA (DUF1232 family)
MGRGVWLAKQGLLRALLTEARIAVRLLREPAVPGLIKALPAAAALYLIWPIDILPDIFPLLGQLDDIGVVLAAVQGFIHLCPDAAARFHRKAVADARPYSPMPAARDGFIDAEFSRE